VNSGAGAVDSPTEESFALAATSETGFSGSDTAAVEDLTSVETLDCFSRAGAGALAAPNPPELGEGGALGVGARTIGWLATVSIFGEILDAVVMDDATTGGAAISSLAASKGSAVSSILLGAEATTVGCGVGF
jgi:hypothetical protein